MNAQLPDAEPFFLLKQHPLLCGLFAFALKARYQELCVTFVNAWGSIMYSAHLYNAVRQENLLSHPWRDMEIAITMQSPEVLFVGNNPTTLQEYDRRFMLSIGVSATAFASNRRRNAPIASAKGPRGLKELGPAWKLFGGRYCNNDRTVSFTPESIKPIIEGKLEDGDDDQEMASSAAGGPKPTSSTQGTSRAKQAQAGTLLKKKKRNTSAIQRLDFLEDIANALHAESLELTFDYLMLHRFCWRLLRHVNDKCKPKLLEMYGAGYLEKENQLPFVVGYIFSAANKASALVDHLLPNRTKEVTSRLLMTAAEAMAELFSSGGDDIQIHVLRKWLGIDIDFSGLMDTPANEYGSRTPPEY